MKLNHFHYKIVKRSGEIHCFDIAPLFTAFCNIESAALKNSFGHAGERLYLFQLPQPRTYMFVKTAQNEFIHKIDRQSLNYSEIANELRRNESLGFASYIHVGDKFMSIASTFSAPRHTAFAAFVNDLFAFLNLQDVYFKLEPIAQSASRPDVLRMPHVGRMHLGINSSNGFFNSIGNFFNAEAHELDDIESIEVIIKPKRNRDNKATTRKVFDALGGDGIEKLMVRAKEDLDSKLADIYIEGQSVLYDYIESNAHIGIPIEINAKIRENQLLREKLNEILQDEAIRQEVIEQLSTYFNVDNWTPHLGDL